MGLLRCIIAPCQCVSLELRDDVTKDFERQTTLLPWFRTNPQHYVPRMFLVLPVLITIESDRFLVGEIILATVYIPKDE